MKRSTRRSHRHRNPRQDQTEQKPAFFVKTSDANLQAREDASFFQPKLTISPANDPAEKEADAMADQVVKGVQQSGSQVQKKGLINRAGEKEEPKARPEMQRQKAEEKEMMSAKMEVQRQGEDEEKLKSKPEIQRQNEEEEAKPKLEVQRQTEEEKPQAKSQEVVSAGHESSEAPSPDYAAPSRLEAMIRQTKGQGFALPNDTRQEMEAQFEADLTKVRIHTDDQAIEMCRMIRAQAFTHGYDIYFNAGKYDPDTDTGKNLLAHELTHVVQQKGK